VVYGSFKVGTGVVLVGAGSAADVTGIGASIGIPADVFGLYQIGSGSYRLLKGTKQLVNAIMQPQVCGTNFWYLEGGTFGIVPFGSVLQRLLGGMS
jgi:hypothetical protein